MQEIKGVKSNGPMLVGIGASAGGVEALLRFFERTPPDTGLAFAVVVHAASDHENRLAEVLRTKTRMPVESVTDATRVEADRVYCIPPDRGVRIVDGHFRPVGPEMTNGCAAPIDLFFRTLAHAYRDKAIAVVLSGAGADGSLGLGRVHEEGGVSVAQDPAEAEHAAMPQRAIETGFVDFVLPVGAIPEKLVSLKQNAERIQLPPAKKATRGFEEDSLRELLVLLRARTRHDFTSYKRSTLLRRIERRLQVTESEDIPAYLDHIRRHPDELQGLLRDLLISVTNFFRDPEAFQRLGKNVVPRLFENKGADDQIRVWVSGCATGEEAYSLAMLLAEHADTLTNPPRLQVFATDIDEEALAQGRNGLYAPAIAADVTPDRLKRFFVKEGPYYRVKRELRETVLFAPHNILRDPPFSKLDLISCRNLLIYINRNTQERVLEVFHFALKPEGYLFLGSSESAEGLTDIFKPVDKKYRIFRRHDDGSSDFKPAPTPPVPGSWVMQRPALRPPATGASPEGFTYGELHYRMLEAFAPPSVLVNSDYDIVHLSERAGRFLRLAGGEPTRNLLKVVHPALRLELRSLLIAVANEGESRSGPVSLNLDGEQSFVRLAVLPLDAPQSAQSAPGFVLVIFEEVNAPLSAAGGDGAGGADQPAGGLEPVVRHLEAELERTRERLRASVEEYGTSLEELKASNEELQAMNEELRSASEELETGKEELQSINEELTTLNIELREKVDEIGRSNSDLQNLMGATRVATLFLDRGLRLKRYTPTAQELFNVIPGDLGRPLAHITHQLDYPALVADAERVLADLHLVEREVQTHGGHWYIARLLPYRTTDDKINGVVLTLTDNHERKLAVQTAAEDLRDTRLLRDLSVRLVTEENVQVIYDEILTAAVALSRADAGTVQILDADTQELEMLAAQGLTPGMADRFRRVEAGGGTVCGAAMARAERTFIDYDDPQAEDPDGSLRMHAEQGLRSGQSTPLVTRSGRVIGMVSTHWREHRRASEREQHFLDLLARQAADLIELRQAQQALRLLEDRYDELFNSIEQGFCTVEVAFDGDGKPTDYRFLEVSPSFAWQAGIENAAGRWMREIAPDQDETWFANFGHVALTGEPLRFEAYSTPFQRWWSVYAFRVEDPSLRRVGVLFNDISSGKSAEQALRASEEQLRLVIETADDYAIMLLDEAGRYTSWNSGAEKMFGYAEAEIVGQPAALIFTPEDRAAGAPEQEVRTAAREGRATDERWHVRKDGTRLYCSGVMVSLRHGHGYAKIARDLTAQRQAQEELQRAWEELDRRVQERTAELAEANSAMRAEVAVRRRAEQERKGLLRRIVSTQEDERRRISRELHDQLGQSLTALRLKLEGLRDEAGKRSKLQGRIGELVEIAQRLDADVDFLAWELRPTALDDLGLIVALSNYAQEWSRHFGVELDFHSAGLGDARLAPLVETSLYRITQEALNNVSKHAEATKVALLLERRDDHAVLIVEDDGRGFDPEALDAGTDVRGMGLVGMRERAALVGGTVEVESRPGEGTTVFVRVPVNGGQ